MKDAVRKWLEEFGEDLLMADGFDDAIIGVGERCGQPMVVIYDAAKCVDILIRRDGMSQQDALEHMSYNVIGAWHGDETPVWMHCHYEEEDDNADDGEPADGPAAVRD